MTDHPIPTLHDILTARANVYRHLRPTPLHHYAGLSQLVGAQVWVKHENHQPIGAFKVRGGLNLVAGLSEAERRAGLFTASTGNHGQSIAFAAAVRRSSYDCHARTSQRRQGRGDARAGR